MDNYFLVKNDFINAIDDDYFNLAFIRKQRFYFTSEPGIIHYSRTFEVDITGIDFPVIAFSFVCPSAYLSMKANKLSIVSILLDIHVALIILFIKYNPTLNLK